MFNLVPENEPESAGDIVAARLNVRVRPADRRQFYTSPLGEMLQEGTLGEVAGAGTQVGENGEIEFCELEIQLASSASDKVLDEIRECLEAQGAAKGSVLIVERDGREIPFGVNEGLAVYLNGTDLPDSVYEQCDVDVVCEEFEKLLGSNGRIQSYWDGPSETALYLYGTSYDQMVGCIQPFLDSYPLCEKARLEKIA